MSDDSDTNRIALSDNSASMSDSQDDSNKETQDTPKQGSGEDKGMSNELLNSHFSRSLSDARPQQGHGTRSLRVSATPLVTKSSPH